MNRLAQVTQIWALENCTLRGPWETWGMGVCSHWDLSGSSVTEISQETAVNPVDIVSTLQALQMLKYWKGKHLVLKRQVRFSSAACGVLNV